MSNLLDKHVAAYQGDNLYDFDNEILLGCGVDRLEGIYLKPFTNRQVISLQLDRDVINAPRTVGIDYPELSCGLLAEIATR
jgi:hypothetical protein